MLLIGPVQVTGSAALAPMAGLTDVVFRKLCREQGCGLVYTELLRADQLARARHGRRLAIETDPAERPLAVQLYHSEPEVLAEAARWVGENVPCDLVDLNMGCPVPRIVSRGAGAAMMRDARRVERVVRTVASATRLPVTVKTRSGWDVEERNVLDVVRAVEAGGGMAVAVHARTTSQRHDGPVDLRLLADVKRAVGIPVIGNGGIRCPDDALRMLDRCGVDAVMVGRGAIGNPWIFAGIEAAVAGRRHAPPSLDERLAVLLRHLFAGIELVAHRARRGRDRREAPERAVRGLRGQVVGYLRGSPGERAALRRVNDLHTPEQVVEAVREAWLADPQGDRAGT